MLTDLFNLAEFSLIEYVKPQEEMVKASRSDCELSLLFVDDQNTKSDEAGFDYGECVPDMLSDINDQEGSFFGDSFQEHTSENLSDSSKREEAAATCLDVHCSPDFFLENNQQHDTDSVLSMSREFETLEFEMKLTDRVTSCPALSEDSSEYSFTVQDDNISQGSISELENNHRKILLNTVVIVQESRGSASCLPSEPKILKPPVRMASSEKRRSFFLTSSLQERKKTETDTLKNQISCKEQNLKPYKNNSCIPVSTKRASFIKRETVDLACILVKPNKNADKKSNHLNTSCQTRIPKFSENACTVKPISSIVDSKLPKRSF